MNRQDKAPGLWDNTPAGNYVLVCAAALLVLLLVLLQRGMERWSLLPILVGGPALLFRWRLAPLMLLLSVGGLLYLDAALASPRLRAWQSRLAPSMSDFLLCAAMLAYLMGHYRLQGLQRNVFPHDPRLDRQPRDDMATRAVGYSARARVFLFLRRSARLVAAEEAVWLLVTLPLCAGAAQLLWLGIAWTQPGLRLGLSREGLLDVAPEVWMLIWVLGLGLLIVGSLFGYLSRRAMTAEEAALFLQDVAWKELRREQRRLHSWRAWGLAKKRRKESE